MTGSGDILNKNFTRGKPPKDGSCCIGSSLSLTTSCELGHQLLRRVDIRPEVLGQSTRDTETVTHPTIQGNATTARELGEGFRKESPRLSVREYVKLAREFVDAKGRILSYKNGRLKEDSHGTENENLFSEGG